MKLASNGRNFSARAIWSTVVGETADSLIFFPVAFGGIIAWRELLVMMCIQILLKSMYEVLILPVTIRVVKAIKRIDGSDVYDEGISYKVLENRRYLKPLPVVRGNQLLCQTNKLAMPSLFPSLGGGQRGF